LERLSNDGRTVGMRLSRPVADGDGNATAKQIDVDFTDSFGWRCDCEDATYRPNRPGGCKHVASLRQVAELLRGTDKKSN
jgi:hypothetical protein